MSVPTIETASAVIHVSNKFLCGICRAPGQLYAAGWRCDDHSPGRIRERLEPVSPAHPVGDIQRGCLTVPVTGHTVSIGAPLAGRPRRKKAAGPRVK